MRVTNFNVEFSETRKIADYETRKISIQVSVNVDDDEKALPALDQVLAEIRKRVEKQQQQGGAK